MPEPVQAHPAGKQPGAKRTWEENHTDIETGLADLNLYAGQRKNYIMKACGLKFAPDLSTLTIGQQEMLLQQLEADLLA